MQTPNTPTQSRKYPTEGERFPAESEMPQSTRTKLSVSHLNTLRKFLDVNDMEDVTIGYYSLPDETHIWQSTNYICYAYSTNNEKVTTNLSYMTLKYGGLEKAFQDFLKATSPWR